MLKATIKYSSHLVEYHCFEIEMSVLQRPLMREQGMQLQFQFRETDTAKVKPTSKALFHSYAPWSESPTALALRALFALYTDWPETTPEELKHGRVTSMQIVISHVHDQHQTDLASVSATLATGTSESYQVKRTIDGDTFWPLQIKGDATVPLGMALKLLAFENSAPIDYSTFPPDLEVEVVNRKPGNAVAIASVPDYARSALLAYAGHLMPDVEGPMDWVPASTWYAFLAA